MFAAFLAPSVIEHTYGSMRHLLVCQLHLVKRPVNHPRCSQRLEVFATTVSVTDQQEMQHDFLKDFSSVILYDSVTNIYAREKGSLIIIMKGANEKFNQMFRDKIKKDKEKFTK